MQYFSWCVGGHQSQRVSRGNAHLYPHFSFASHGVKVLIFFWRDRDSRHLIPQRFRMHNSDHPKDLVNKLEACPLKKEKSYRTKNTSTLPCLELSMPSPPGQPFVTSCSAIAVCMIFCSGRTFL